MPPGTDRIVNARTYSVKPPNGRLSEQSHSDDPPHEHRPPPLRQVNDGQPERIRGEVEESLVRMGTDHLDLLYLHAADQIIPIEESAGS